MVVPRIALDGDVVHVAVRRLRRRYGQRHILATTQISPTISTLPSSPEEDEMAHERPHVHEVASGDINVWVDPGGAICLKVTNKFNDPAELSEHEALELANLLIRLVKESRDGVSE
jgi:hypothetical protein